MYLSNINNNNIYIVLIYTLENGLAVRHIYIYIPLINLLFFFYFLESYQVNLSYKNYKSLF